MAKKSSNERREGKASKTAQRVQRNFPRASLSEAIRIPLALKEYNGGNAWPPSDVAKVVDSSVGNASITSNHFFYLSAAARDFGFTTGTRDTVTIALTDLGREFAYAGTPEAEKHALRKAFHSVEIFRRVFDHYGGEQLPDKKFVANTLEATFGLDPAIHDEFLELFRENVQYLGSALTRGEVKDLTEKTLTPTTVSIGSLAMTDDLVVVAEPEQPTSQTMFVAIPFRERDSGRAPGFFMEVLRQLVGPAGAKAGFRVVTANQKGTDVIQSTIVNSLFDADLVLADLTEHNPNVLFELGVRMAIDRPVALIRAEGTGRIFDVDNMLRVFDYSPHLWRSTIESDLPNLTAHIKASWDRRDSDRTYMKILRAGDKIN